MTKTEKDPVRLRFADLLLGWDLTANKRSMPWKGEKDPYRIWLSEIILQQTRVDQGTKYYQHFIKAYPDVHALAASSDEQAFKLWEGLGYYNRCRNLLASARIISKEYNGKFPNTYEDITALKGVGPYTAAAIASFAFGLPHAVVDGNVFRVLARIFGIETPVDSTKGKKEFTELANELLDKNEPARYNQAIMDFGATICKPVAPLCETCVFRVDCIAYRDNRIAVLPVKEKKAKIRRRWFYYFIIEHQNRIAIVHRDAKDIWQSLFEFPVIETESETPTEEIIREAEQKKWIIYDLQHIEVSGLFKQQLSHQLIVGRFIRMRSLQPVNGEKNWQWIERSKLHEFAFPQLINQYLKSEGVQQSLL